MFKEYRTLLPYFKKYARRYLIGFIFLTGVDGIQLIIPQIIKRAVNLIASGSFALSEVGILAGLIGLVALAISGGRFVWRVMIFGAARRIEAEMRQRLFAKFMELSERFYQGSKIGDLMARATNDLSQVRQSAGMGFVSFTDGVFMLVGILIMMFLSNPGIALLTVLPLPVITILVIAFGSFVGKRFKRVQDVYARMSDIAQETMAGVRIVKAFVREKAFADKFARANDEYRGANMTLVGVFGFFFPLIAFLSGLTMLILIGAGGRAVIGNSFSAGDVVAMMAYLEMLIWPMLGAGFMVNIIQRGAASLKRVNEVLEAESEIIDSPGALSGKPEGSIEIRDLSFRYKDCERDILSSLSLRLEKGNSLGILGRTGSGKTTLIKLLPRLIDPPPGTVFVGGSEAAAWSLGGLRSAFGFVPQDSFLFSASIKENIAFGAPEADEERLGAAARAAALTRDLELFPQGWDTLVGERGLSLSGGQKQRVAIARALAIDPEILVLDDALSAVDAETEERILSALLEARRGRTTLMVSQRIAALRRMDSAIVLEGGRIVQAGTHDELMSQEQGFYAEIARLQAIDEGGGLMAEYFEAEEVTRGYDHDIVKRIFSYVRPHRARAIATLAALAVSTLGEIFLPILSQRIIDRALMPSWRRVSASALSEGGDIAALIQDKSPGPGGWAYLRAQELRSVSASEQLRLESAGLLDEDEWYLCSSTPAAETALAALEGRGIRVERAAEGDARAGAAILKKDLLALKPAEAFALRSDDLRYLSRAMAVFLGILAAILLSTFFQTWLSSLIGQLVMKDIRMDLFSRTAGQSLAFLGRHPVGRLVTRMTSDVETINEFFTSVVVAFLKDLSVMAGVVIAFFVLDPGLGLVAVLSLPPVLALTMVSRVRARDAFSRQRTWTSRVNAFISEHLSGIGVVKLFVREAACAKDFSLRNESLLKAGLGEMYVFATFRPLVDFLASVSTGVVIWFGAKFFLESAISLGTLIAFINLIRMFYSPVMDISEKYTILQSAMAGGERVFSLLDANEPIPDLGKLSPPDPIRGGIEFEKVNFAYKKGEPVIRDLSFRVEPGEMVAIVGYTGAGKTTIASLLTRMWDRDSGMIRVDGMDIADMPLGELRRAVQPMLQDIFLFSGSIKDNISLGAEMGDDKIREAARAVGAEEFILKLPQGYETPLSEGASNISAGQRQLLSFARAVAQGPRVIILDEATSNVDTETERMVQRGLEGLLAGRTSIVIAHRLSTIRHAKRIFVLSRGRLAEEGSHEELLAKKGLYWSLYRLQYADSGKSEAGAGRG